MTSERSRDGKALAKSIQDAIDRGTTTVEEIHKSIADLPLKILEESELLRGPARQVMRVQDRTIGAVYDVIRGINERIGTLATELLSQAAKRRAERADAGVKHHGSHKAAAR